MDEKEIIYDEITGFETTSNDYADSELEDLENLLDMFGF